MADKVHATAASPKASWGLRSGAHQRWKQQMGGICVTSLSFTVPFFVSDTFTGKYWGLQLLLYKLKYKAMKKYESNSKSQGLNRNMLRFLYHLENCWWLLMITSSSMLQFDHAVRCCVWQRHFPNTRVQFRCCDTRGTVNASEAIQDVTASSCCSPAMKQGSFHSASAVN